MNDTELRAADSKFKLAFWGILAVAGAAIYSLTRKSQAEQVPPALPPSPAVVTPVHKPLVALPPLDAGLSSAEVLAVQKALSTETLAANLNGFASTFEPMFPIAANLLRAKAKALASGVSVTAGKDEPCCDDCAKGDKPPCTPKVTGAPIFRGLPSTLGVDIA